MLPLVKLLLKELEIDKAAKIAAFYDFTKDELEFLVGEKAEEIVRFVEEHNLHRIEDETFLSTFEVDKVAKDAGDAKPTAEEVDMEMDEGKTDEGKTKKKKVGKNLTLDSFFS